MTASLIKIIRFLVSSPTVSSAPNLEIIDYLDNFFSNLGFTNIRISHPQDPKRANLLCKIGPELPGGLMISGHTDVVPVSGQNWSSDPFKLSEKNGRYIGRGTTDMKGFIAASCYALSRIDFTALKIPLSLLWTYDEEIGCSGSAVAAPLLKNYFKYLPEAALIGEPTDFNIFSMHSGHASLRITVKGKGAHSSNPRLGISAIKGLNQILSALFKFEEELKQEGISLNVGHINGGSAVNIIPDEATAVIGFRPLPDSSIDVIFKRIEHIAQGACYEPGAKISVTLEQCTPPMMSKSGSRLEKVISAYARPSEQRAAAFSTDAGNLSVQGINCLIFGPGSIDIAHQADEYINIADLEQAVDTISNIVKNYTMATQD